MYVPKAEKVHLSIEAVLREGRCAMAADASNTLAWKPIFFLSLRLIAPAGYSSRIYLQVDERALSITGMPAHHDAPGLNIRREMSFNCSMNLSNIIPTSSSTPTFLFHDSYN
jgi:hypothetical protein